MPVKAAASNTGWRGWRHGGWRKVMAESWRQAGVSDTIIAAAMVMYRHVS